MKDLFNQIIEPLRFFDGHQEWLYENLAVTHFQNGDPIHISQSPGEWVDCHNKKMPSCCACNFNENFKYMFGYIYNIHAIIDARGLFSRYYKLPEADDWKNLIDFFNEDPGVWNEREGSFDKAINNKIHAFIPRFGDCFSNGQGEMNLNRCETQKTEKFDPNTNENIIFGDYYYSTFWNKNLLLTSIGLTGASVNIGGRLGTEPDLSGYVRLIKKNKSE